MSTAIRSPVFIPTERAERELLLPVRYFPESLRHISFRITSFVATGGLGDLACGAKIAALLQRAGIPRENITLVTEYPRDMIPFRDIHQCRVLSVQEAATLHGIGMHIIAPVEDEATCFESLAQKIPVLMLGEYGAPPLSLPLLPRSVLSADILGLNLSKEELGILIDEELFAFGHSSETLLPIRRAEKLIHLPPALAASLEMQPSHIEEFVQKKLLFYGYASLPSTAAAFILSLALLTKENTRDLVIVLPKTSMSTVLPILQESLSMLHASTLSFSTYQNQQVMATHPPMSLISPNKRTILVLTGSFSLAEVKTFLMASEKETIATGDQSLSEALSANKLFFYETRVHKKEVAQTLHALYGEDCSFLESDSPSDLPRRMVAYFSKNLSDEYKRVSHTNRQLCLHTNCQATIVEKITTLFEQCHSQEEFPLTVLTERNPLTLAMIPRERPTLLTREQFAWFYQIPPSQYPEPNPLYYKHEGGRFTIVLRK